MSILSSFPRIYFNGFMSWNVCTANNNDYVPAYAMSEAGLNWDYLSQFGVTQENFQDTFRPWVINPSDDVVVSSGASDNCPLCTNNANNGNTHLSSRWNYYGSAAASMNTFGPTLTKVIGGATGVGAPVTSDPIIGKPVSITGSQGTSAGRLVDIDPSAPWVSQLILQNIHAGDPLTSPDGFFIDGPATVRMFSRAFNAPRNIDSRLIIAGAIGVLFQTTIATEGLTIQNPNNGSALLTALQTALQESNAAGVMLRFTAYNTLYYQNGLLNSTKQQPRGCCDLWAMYKAGEVFSNPAYSQLNGTFGIWNEGELSTAPSGSILIPNGGLNPVTSPSPSANVQSQMIPAGHTAARGPAVVEAAAAAAPTLPSWGLALAEIDFDNEVASLDLSNAILQSSYGDNPFYNGTNIDVGPVSFGVLNSDGFLTINTIPYENGYDAPTYVSCSGIYDLPFNGVTAQQVQDALAVDKSTLALQVGAPSNSYTCQEYYWTADTDQRGVYIDQDTAVSVNVQVRYRGQIPPPGTQVLLTQYYAWPPQVGSSFWVLGDTLPPPNSGYPVPDQPPPLNVGFADGTIIPVDENGNAVVNVLSVYPGFPVVALYPFRAVDDVPVPAPTVTFGAPYPAYTIGFAPYFVCRVLPFDNGLYSQFADCWNATGPYTGQPMYDRDQAWTFIYGKILYLYDMLYPVMDQFMPLGNLPDVEAKINQLLALISTTMLDTTLYMPVTRELSAGKRLVLQAWGYLVINNYPQEPLPIDPFLLPPPPFPQADRGNAGRSESLRPAR
ncbi:MAG: hypothetical protein QOC81_1500 [Thermoanaerobaculia bacterium]|jgi:hypothetical protein|nr:hypothetical protein [Thermoanaerobaculia bacterium]